tara:strand:+ start:1891 stop:2199 length:309 start_codon:yes stop_codon:yes gene_type:complete
MQVITLKVADNGVIKEIKDDNINAGGESYESIRLYEFIDSNRKLNFINEVCVDIGLDFGNSRQSNQIQVVHGWGEHYTPSKNEINEKIIELQNKIEELLKIK